MEFFNKLANLSLVLFVSEKNTKKGEKVDRGNSSISLNIAGAKGYYFVAVTNTLSGKQSVSKILVQ